MRTEIFLITLVWGIIAGFIFSGITVTLRKHLLHVVSYRTYVKISWVIDTILLTAIFTLIFLMAHGKG